MRNILYTILVIGVLVGGAPSAQAVLASDAISALNSFPLFEDQFSSGSNGSNFVDILKSNPGKEVLDFQDIFTSSLPDASGNVTTTRSVRALVYNQAAKAMI